MISLGKKAPSFTLPDQDGAAVALSGLAGEWVVLYFYPRDDTPGCTVEACEFTAAMPQFTGMKAQVFGCSPDAQKAHQKFIHKHKLGIRLLTDADKSVMKSYGAFGKKLMYGKPVEGVIRSTVLIDPQGKVAAHWPKVQAQGHAAEVAQKLAALQGGGAVAKPAKPAKKAAKKTAKKTAKKAAKKKVGKKAAAKPAKKAAKKAKR